MQIARVLCLGVRLAVFVLFLHCFAVCEIDVDSLSLIFNLMWDGLLGEVFEDVALHIQACQERLWVDSVIYVAIEQS